MNLYYFFNILLNCIILNCIEISCVCDCKKSYGREDIILEFNIYINIIDCTIHYYIIHCTITYTLIIIL